MLGDIPERKVVVFNEEAAWTPQEKKASLWLCGLILALVGLPSLAVAVVSTTFNAMFAYSLGAAPDEKAAWVLASLGFSLFVIGIPIARPSIRERRPDLDRKAFWLWIACLGFSITSALGFAAYTRDHSATARGDAIKGRTALEAEIARLEKEFDALPGHRPAAAIEGSLQRAIAANAITSKFTENCTRFANKRDRDACAPVLALREELAAAQSAGRLEEKLDSLRERLKAAPQAGSVSDPQADVLDWLTGRRLGADVTRRLLSIFVALLVEAGSAIGLSVAAEAFVAVLRERSQTAPQAQPMHNVLDLQAVDLPQVAQLDAEGGFFTWAERCVSISKGGRIRASDAFGRYETWCGQNGIAALPLVTFGRRMTDHITRRGARVTQSNGRVYEDVRVADGEAKLLGGPNA